MKIFWPGKILLLAGISALNITSLDAQAPEKTSSFLSPIAFFTAHEWDAKLPDSPEGKKRKIHAQFTWSRNRQVICISNQFVTDGKARPYSMASTLGTRSDRRSCWYVDAGWRSQQRHGEDGSRQLVHEFEEIGADGKSSAYVAKVTPHEEQIGTMKSSPAEEVISCQWSRCATRSRTRTNNRFASSE